MSKHCAERGEICAEPRALPSAAAVGGPEQSRGERRPLHERGADILDFRTLVSGLKTDSLKHGSVAKENESDPQEVASFLTDQLTGHGKLQGNKVQHLNRIQAGYAVTFIYLKWSLL